MSVLERVCIKSFKDPTSGFRLEEGETYLTSVENKDGDVCVFTNFWAWMPAREFFTTGKAIK